MTGTLDGLLKPAPPKHGELIFVSAPYSDPNPKVVDLRMTIFTAMMGLYASRGETVVSPLWFHYAVKLDPALASDWTFWKPYSESLLSRCARMRILRIPGWDVSTGVTGERAYAETFDIPVEFADPPSGD